jgi:uncharacterized protein YhaN
MLKSHDVPDVPTLQAKLEGVRSESTVAASAVRDLEDRFPSLRELADSAPEELLRHQVELEQRIKKSSERVEELEEQHETLRHRAAGAEAEGRRLGNAAALEIEVRELGAEEEQLLLERDATRLAFETLQEAAARFGHTHRERLVERATELMRDLSIHPTRTIDLGERYEILVDEGDAQPCAIRQLSQGARDQLALSLRLAVADLLSAGIRPPLLLDDPFLAFDPKRTDAARQALAQIATDRQVILLSHREDLAAWGRSIVVAG